MVGKTPQVREIVYNVLDDNGDRTVVAKGATTVDVGDTQQLFTRTTALESLTSDNVSNISDVQSNILALEANFSSLDLDADQVYSPLIATIQGIQTIDNQRIDVLEDINASNSIVINNNFSNIIDLQSNLESNALLLSELITDHVSNVANINGNFSNISILQEYTGGTFSNVSTLQTSIGAIVNYGPITTLQTDVASLKDRITLPKVIIGDNAGTFSSGKSISIGQQAGQYIGTNSIGIGAGAQLNTNPQERTATKNSIVINARGISLRAPRSDTLVIRPIQTDDSNTINIMGYNETYGEMVQSTLLRGIDGNVHATSNIIVNDDAIVFETNGNGSFGGIVEINSNIEVGGTSSFTGAMQMASTLEVGDTSLFVGGMTVHDSVNVHGQSFILYNGLTAKKIILRNDGTGSFLNNVDIGGALEVGGTSSFNGAMQMASTLEVGGTSSFTGGMALGNGADLIMNVSSFKMKDVGGTETIKITSESGSASFAGLLDVHNIDCGNNIDIYNSFYMRAANQDIYATINKDGVSSFAGKMEIANELVVGLNSSFVGGIVVPSTSSFGGAVTVNSTSTFTGDVTLGTGADLIMNSESFSMKSVSGEKVYIRNDGNASFAGNLNVNTIDCRDNIDIYNSFYMRDSGENIYATINKDGESSFAGKMQINNALDVDGTVKIVHDGSERITMTPDSGTTNSIVKVVGNLQLYNNMTKNVEISHIGTGSFQGTVTAAGFSTGTEASISSIGNASFAGTMEMASTLTVGGTSSFASGMEVGGTPGTTCLTTGGDISIGGSSSFASGMEVGGTPGTTCLTTGGDISIGGSSSFASGMEVGGSTASTSITTGGKITAGGDIQGLDFIIPSDRRFKTEITHIPNALDKIKQISGCTYKVGDKPSAGVIAQEILKVLPEVVHTREDGYYAVSYHGLIGLLIEAVKELSEKVK